MTKAELITLLVMAVGLWLLIQFTGLKFWHAAVVFAAGFYLATSAAGVADQRPGRPHPRHVRALGPGPGKGEHRTDEEHRTARAAHGPRTRKGTRSEGTLAGSLVIGA